MAYHAAYPFAFKSNEDFRGRNPYGAYGVVVGGYGPTPIVTSLDRFSPYAALAGVAAGTEGAATQPAAIPQISALLNPGLALPGLLPGVGGVATLPLSTLAPAVGTAPAGDAAALTAPAAAPVALPAGWETTVDPASGKVYYFNRATQESSWTVPSA
eukprot:g12093.t1